ncbi:helix-turn-helix domain-containing protein [Streptomyces sp. NBC_01207]|uniref:helix-turn-helix domain-containing protein n=1 Tax=Streptomyces sp. NBC_01207 TaxID=2903772 RepID=UPI003FA3AC4A|nr:helix-turn-helix domain-containing protein [Streptomyces sp. NBC_01207]
MGVDPLWSTRKVRALVDNQRAGSLVRVGRKALGWRQTDLGVRLRCSASTVSRIEHGQLTDLTLLRRAAREVGVPVDLLAASLGLMAQRSPRVAEESSPPALEDPLLRRTAIAVGLTAPLGLLTGLEKALAATPDPTGSRLPLDSRLAAARSLFDAGHYDQLLQDLPGLLGDAHHATASRTDLDYARLSSAYTLAATVLNKRGDYALSRLTADRAQVYADVSGSPLASAAAARELAAVLRHQGQEAAAQRLIQGAVARVEATGLSTDAQAAAYAQMLASTAYTAAVAGDRDQAHTMIREAGRAARELPLRAPAGRLFPITPAAVDLYAVGVHWALGDAGAALEAGRNLHASQFPTRERKGRMHTDLGRAWWQWGKPEQAAAALLAAVRVSPGEVRDRPPIRAIVTELQTRHPRVTGVAELVAATKTKA